jgi:uncharacterized protein (TIGR02145 family)
MKSPTYISLVSICLILAVSFGTGCGSGADPAKSDAKTESPDSERIVRDGDGNEYRTVQIGNQVWFAENLRSSTYRNGDPIPGGLSDKEWTSTSYGAQSVYREGSRDEAKNLENYGRLYNWYAVHDPRGLCPTGWHVPSDEEWTVLENHLGGSTVEGAALKSSTSDSPAWNGDNSSGFSALPGGHRDYLFGNFVNQGDYGLWWSSSPNGSSAWYRTLNSQLSNVYRGSSYGARSGFSVRCVRD